MIVTADLDHTLIFSKRRLAGQPVVAAEYRKGEPVGFMTAQALANLRALQKSTAFLVNTMRDLEQAKRVVFVGDGGCRYLSVQNGLVLYRDGVLDEGWERTVGRVTSALALGTKEASGRVMREIGGIECLSRMHEHLAVFFVEEAFDERACKLLAREFRELGWLLYLQRPKLYLTPLGIDKGAVLHRVRELEGKEEAVGFGDSYFDLPMLAACEEAYAPKGCELESLPRDFFIRFSSEPGESGAEEIVATILNQTRNRSKK